MSNIKLINKDIMLNQYQNKKYTKYAKFGKYNLEVPVEVVNGEMLNYPQLRQALDTIIQGKVSGEMITSSQMASGFIKKIVLDVELGKLSNPTVYEPIYQIITDSSFPKVLDTKWLQEGTVVYLEHVEGQEVKFGSIASEQGPTARIITYSAGFEYTKDMIAYNEGFNITLLNQALGKAQNGLLNHIHLNPIISGTYTGGNTTPASTEYDDPAYGTIGPKLKKILNTKQTLIDAVEDTSVYDSNNRNRAGSNILLINSANRQLINDAIGAHVVNGSEISSVLGISTIIEYDGETFTVGDKTYTYGGVPTTKCFLIRPKENAKSLVKTDFEIERDNADISRLVEDQLVSYTRRGIYINLTRTVQEVNLPTA